jgi:hypothetical protein
MTQASEWICQVSPAGHLPGQVRRELDDLVRALAGKRIRIKLALYRKQRSTNQNAYLWGVVYPPIVAMFREAGNGVDAEDIHSYLKEHVGKLKQVFVTPDGEVLTGPGSTAKLSTVEMEVYLEKVRAWAAEHGVGIPLPNEQSGD